MKPVQFVLAFLLLGSLGLFIPLALAEGASPTQAAQEGQVIFQQKCSPCHTIGGGKLVGPDLEGVTGRRDLAWLQGFIAAPDKLIAAGDPVAVQLLAENNNVAMPNLGLAEGEVAALLSYLENPAAAGAAVAAAPVALPPGGAQTGLRLFQGETALANGGPACIACHTVGGAGVLGGGSLGPDLTQVYRRLGEPGLASSLNTIVFPTMQGPFLNRPLTPQEQADLVAFFALADQQAPVPAANLTASFLVGGALGALALFGIMAIFWPRQRESLSLRLRRSQ